MIDYSIHPSFKFDQNELVVSQKIINDFSNNYFHIKDFGASLDKSSAKILIQDCFRLLKIIFSSLDDQVSGEIEKLFLRELYEACARILIEDFSWFLRSRPSMKIRHQNAFLDAEKLRSQKFFLGKFSNDVIDEIKFLSRGALEKFRLNAADGKFKRNDLSINSGGLIRNICAILNTEYEKLGVLEALSLYNGVRTKVVGASLELSVPDSDWWANGMPNLPRPPKTLYAHLDESISRPKSIVYLSDVTAANGPTSCYPHFFESIKLNPLQEVIGRVIGTIGSDSKSLLNDFYKKKYHQSMSSENFRRHFMLLPSSLRFNSHFGWDVMPGERIESQLVDCEKTIIGDAGTFLIFDGANLLHRGGLVESQERIALQVIFSDTSVYQRALSKLKRIFV